MRGISWLAEDVLAYQEGICSIELVSLLVILWLAYITLDICMFLYIYNIFSSVKKRSLLFKQQI
jgi:hypothetical protein